MSIQLLIITLIAAMLLYSSMCFIKFKKKSKLNHAEPKKLRNIEQHIIELKDMWFVDILKNNVYRKEILLLDGVYDISYGLSSFENRESYLIINKHLKLYTKLLYTNPLMFHSENEALKFNDNLILKKMKKVNYKIANISYGNFLIKKDRYYCIEKEVIVVPDMLFFHKDKYCKVEDINHLKNEMRFANELKDCISTDKSNLYTNYTDAYVAKVCYI